MKATTNAMSARAKSPPPARASASLRLDREWPRAKRAGRTAVHCRRRKSVTSKGEWVVSAARIVVAGGHSAGHIEPAMNFADAVRRLDPSAEITALGTVRGLDTR